MQHGSAPVQPLTREAGGGRWRVAPWRGGVAICKKMCVKDGDDVAGRLIFVASAPARSEIARPARGAMTRFFSLDIHFISLYDDA